MSKIKNVAKYSAMITLVLVLSKIMGFGRELLIAIQFGANRESDIFKIATTTPNVLFGSIASAIVVSFIPIFSNVKDDKKKANEFFNNILNIVTLLCAVLAVIGIVIAPILVKLLASGFEGEAFTRTVEMTRIVMPAIIFLGMSGLYTGYLQSYGIFLQPALTGIAADVVLIIGIVVFYKYGITAAVIAFLFSAAAQVLIQRPFMGEYKYRFFIDFKDNNVRKMILLSLPIIISTTVGQINLMVDRTFASRLVEGSISVVDYASKFSTIINQVFIVSITTVLYPMLTEKFTNNDKDGFQELFKKSVNIVIIVAIPLILGMVVLSTPFIKLVMEHGKFDRTATLATASALRYLAFGALGYSLIDILGKIFFSAKDTVTPMVNGFVMIGLNIILILILVPRFKVNGLALATTLSATIVACIMLAELKHKMKGISYKGILNVLVKTSVSGLIMAILVHLSFSYSSLLLKGDGNIMLAFRLILATIIGAIVYIGGLKFFKVEELNSLITLKFKK